MITDFLKTKRTKEELTTALCVVIEFKQCESQEEWLMIPFHAWTKLEQLEEYLEHLVHGTPLKQDTIDHIEKHKTTTPWNKEG